MSKVKNQKDETKNIETSLIECQEREKRAVADYQNLLRRQQEERVAIIKMAVGDLVSDLVQPLEHLSLAAQQINDQGLNMVIEQFWQVLKQHGLEEISPEIGQEFNTETMEVVERTKTKDQRIKKVVGKGYRLNGKIIKHARVVV